jgi:trehalose-phosphatase
MSVEAALAAVLSRGRGRHLLLLSDFDGTLCGFSTDPGDVYLSRGVRELLGLVAAHAGATLGIISGRTLADLEQRVQLPARVYLAGSHGLEIQGTDDAFRHPEAAAATEIIQALAASAEQRLAQLPGVWLERKTFSVVLHHRGAEHSVAAAAREAFLQAAREPLVMGRLRVLFGASVLELLPNVMWHKGLALDWIRERVGNVKGPTFTVYIGDDVTDQDAFAAIGPHGITIAASVRAAGAEFTLQGPEEVERFLSGLTRILHNG